jgi:hypothetical protein
MKVYSAALISVLLTVTVLFAGCSKDADKGTPPASPETAVSPQPAIVPPAENASRQAAPAPAGPAAPSEAQTKTKPAVPKAQETPKAVQETAKTAEQAPVTPEIKRPAIAQAAPAAPATTAPKAQRFTVPAGTLIPVRMIDSVDSRTDQVGQIYRASIDSDIGIQNQVVLPKGSNASLKLTRVSSAGAIRGKSELQLELDRIFVGGVSYVVASNVVERSAKAEGAKTARDIGIGAAIGAAIGAVTGGKKGAAIGAGVGAGSGAVVAAITKGEQVLVPSETRLEFRLEQPFEITATPGSSTD